MKIFIVFGLAAVAAQPPGGPGGDGPGGDSGDSSTRCAACGSSASYSESLTATTDDGRTIRTVTTTACPNHYSFCTGKAGVDGCGDIGEEGTITEAMEQDIEFNILAYPVFAASTTATECELGPIARALNGVSIYSGAVNTDCDLVDVDSSTSEWTSFDM